MQTRTTHVGSYKQLTDLLWPNFTFLHARENVLTFRFLEHAYTYYCNIS